MFEGYVIRPGKVYLVVGIGALSACIIMGICALVQKEEVFTTVYLIMYLPLLSIFGLCTLVFYFRKNNIGEWGICDLSGNRKNKKMEVFRGIFGGNIFKSRTVQTDCFICRTKKTGENSFSIFRIFCVSFKSKFHRKRTSNLLKLKCLTYKDNKGEVPIRDIEPGETAALRVYRISAWYCGRDVLCAGEGVWWTVWTFSWSRFSEGWYVFADNSE